MPPALADASTVSLPSPNQPGALVRALGALAGALGGALLAGAASGAVRAAEDRAGGAVREAALFAPIAVVTAAALVPLALLASPARIAALRARLALATDAQARALGAALLVAPPVAVAGVALAARAGQVFMTAFHHVGLAALAQAVAFAGLLAALAALYALVRRAVARAMPAGLVRAPATALALGVLAAALLVALGVATGNTDGRGGVLGAYGVLKKPELDLGPVYGLAGAFALGAALTALAARRAIAAVALLVLAGAAGAGLLAHVARHYADAPSAAVIDARPGLARIVLRALRKRTDRDHDGASALFGGGDCDDRNPRRNPSARDVPGNGVDEDCSGTDAPRPAPPAPAPPPSIAQRATRETPADMNLVLITVDTLRWDLHYAGNPRELSPNLDRLASQSIVFDHGYALSSYTGRAVAPMLAGRYPTECARDNEHFTRYPGANVLLAERLKAAGFRTMGAASHFYFERQYGLAQGMDTWDMTARPSSDEQETSSADARVADRAIALLDAPENAQGRFFLWAHFFDPHKQYVRHPELPSFGDGDRARYDGEVMWTDRQIGRLLAALDARPFARRTLVVITADHGEAFGEHGMSWHGVELWEELVRIPWLMRVPGLAPRHVTVPRGQIDLVPTVLELLRVPAPAPDAPDALSGVSLLPDMLGEPLPERPIYIELPEGPFNSLRRSLVFDGWKLTERGARRFELYHLATDPGERTNVAASAPAELARMRTLLEQVRGGLRPVEPVSH